MAVEMVVIFGQRLGRVALVDDEDPVEEFAADAADEPFGDGVGPRCPDWSLDHLDPAVGEDGIEHGRELGVAVADEEPEMSSCVEVDGEVAGQLG
jgi:hypothetical protein